MWALYGGFAAGISFRGSALCESLNFPAPISKILSGTRCAHFVRLRAHCAPPPGAATTALPWAQEDRCLRALLVSRQAEALAADRHPSLLSPALLQCHHLICVQSNSSLIRYDYSSTNDTSKCPIFTAYICKIEQILDP